MKRDNFSYILRSVAGFYLIYLAVQLIGGTLSGEHSGIMPLIAGILFAAVGIGSIFSVIKSMIRSRMPQESEIEKQFDAQNEQAQPEIQEDVHVNEQIENAGDGTEEK